MTYSSGGLIQATDYNSFVTAINAVSATGTGNAGYGQTALSTVAATNTVTATQWSTLIGRLNSTLTHQNNTTTGVTSPVVGNTVAYAAALSTASTNATNNKLLFATQGTTTTGAVFTPNFTNVNTASALTYTITRTATFASADQARYFFNAGGQLNFVVTSVTNGDASNRSAAMATLTATNFASCTAFRQGTNGGRSGTGGTLGTNNTALGYYQMTTTNQNIVALTGTTAAYTADTLAFAANSSGVSGANGDKGNVVTFTLTLTSAAQQGINDSINITVNHRVDVVYPETTNLTNSWGTVTIA